MLKIKKTKPYQFRKLHSNSVTYNNSSNKSKLYTSRVLCSLTLICGIVPSLALLTYYNPYAEKVSAASMSINDISTMQEMRPGICYNMKIGDSATLTDTRDSNTYTIAKLSDGKCWMAENLRLPGGTSLNRTNTDLDSSVYTTDAQTYTLPAATTGGFSDTKYTDSAGTETYMNHQVRNSTDNDYGAYYSWCAATAGTCQIGAYTDIQPDTSIAGNPTKSPANTTTVPQYDQASSSICPKGWRLPTSGPYSDLNTDFYALYRNHPHTQPSAFQTNNNKNGFWLGADSLAKGGAFFPAAGLVFPDNLYFTGSRGYYWSNTAYSANPTHAYKLFFDSTGIYPSSGDSRHFGFSVRCLADSHAEADIDVIAIVVPPVISIDATSGMKEEVDPNLVTKGEISTTISANTTYSVQLSASKTSLTNSASSDEPTPTNSIPASSNVIPKTNAWGILNSDNTTYSAITTNPTTYYNTEEYNEAEQSTKHTFGIGVSISPTLPAGEYSTTVTITAVNN